MFLRLAVRGYGPDSPQSVCVVPSRIMPRLLYALSIFVVLGVSAQAIPRESVRAELAQLEKQTGLILTAYYDGLQVVSFKNHRKYNGKKLVPMEEGADAISPDGTEIALELVRWEKEPRQSLAIVRWDGSDLREYPGIVALDACWSHEQSKLAMTVFIKPNANLGILDLGSKQMHTFEPGPEPPRQIPLLRGNARPIEQ